MECKTSFHIGCTDNKEQAERGEWRCKSCRNGPDRPKRKRTRPTENEVMNKTFFEEADQTLLPTLAPA